MGRKRRHLPATVHPNTWIAETALVDEDPTDAPQGRLPATTIEEGARVDDFSIVYSGAQVRHDAHVGTHCTIGPGAEVKFGARVSKGCYVGAEAVVGEGAQLAPGCIVAPGCGIGTKAYLGPGVRLLNQPRLPPRDPRESPALVGARARIGGGTVICGGVTVGKGAVVAAGEVVEDDVPDGAVWMGGRVAASFED